MVRLKGSAVRGARVLFVITPVDVPCGEKEPNTVSLEMER